MLLFPPIIRRRKRRESPPQMPQPVITLTAANYEPLNYWVTLSFDHAIDLTTFDPTQVEVLDGVVHQIRLTGISWTQTGSGDVRVEMDQNEEYTGPATILNASSTTGIVSPDDGATWPGVSGVVLPFP